MEYEEYERQCVLRREENERHLVVFEKALSETGLSEKTINKHLRNVEFFLNVYLLREAPESMAEGCYRISDYLGNFFIRKCMWSTSASIKSTAASLKKFYKCMLNNGNIKTTDYETLIETIKLEMEFWQEESRVYNDPNSHNPFLSF